MSRMLSLGILLYFLEILFRKGLVVILISDLSQLKQGMQIIAAFLGFGFLTI